MSLRAGSDSDRLTSGRSAGRVKALRRVNFAAFVLLLVQYGFGMYVNLYVTVPAADAGQELGKAISNGPATLSTHALLAFLLVLAAVVLVVQALLARCWSVLTTSAIALAALVVATVEGDRFVGRGGSNGASMAMAVLTGVAMLCYGTALYLLSSPRRV